MNKYKNEDYYPHSFLLGVENRNEEFAHFICESLENTFIPIKTDFDFNDEGIESEEYRIYIWILKSFKGFAKDESRLIHDVHMYYAGLVESFNWCNKNLDKK